MSYWLRRKTDALFDDFSDSIIRTSSTEEVEFKLADSFGYNNEKVSELILEVVFKLGRFAEVDRSSLLLQRRGGLFITECNVN